MAGASGLLGVVSSPSVFVLRQSPQRSPPRLPGGGAFPEISPGGSGPRARGSAVTPLPFTCRALLEKGLEGAARPRALSGACSGHGTWAAASPPPARVGPRPGRAQQPAGCRRRPGPTTASLDLLGGEGRCLVSCQGGLWTHFRQIDQTGARNAGWLWNSPL